MGGKKQTLLRGFGMDMEQYIAVICELPTDISISVVSGCCSFFSENLLSNYCFSTLYILL